MKDTNFKLNARLLASVFAFIISCGMLWAQQVSMRGVVKDASTGEPILGANVLEKGTTNGTITNIDGEFTLKVSGNATLVIKYIGYEAQEVAIAGKSNLNIVLKEDAIALGEVVAIGYGTVKKSDATGSITAIKPEKLNKGLTTNAQDMMVGKIAGVNVTSEGGAPGGGSKIRIRGGSSLNASNDPLIIIDGLAVDNNGIKGVSNLLSTLNPNDIESFTVLKDASSTAIYGSRASNGVILIQTKKGAKNSKLQVNYDGNFNVSNIAKTVDVMNGDQYREYANLLYAGETDILSKLGTANTNWQDQIYQTGIGHEHNLSFSGGIKNLPYRASFGYNNQSGIIKTSNFERVTGSLSLSPSFFEDHLKVNANLKGMYIKNRFADTGAVGDAVRFDPTHPVKSTDEPFASKTEGYWQWITSAGAPNSNAPRNPLALLEQRDDHSKAYDFMGNLDLDYKMHFLPELRAHLNLATNISNGKQDTWVSPYSATNMSNGGYLGYSLEDKWSRQLTAYLQYTKEIPNNNFDIMAGYEWQRFHREGEYFGESITMPEYVYQDAPVLSATHNQLVSFYGRANYTLLDRYLFTATVRADGSSRFSPENRWGTFPSVAFAWKMNEESFMKDVRQISDMKLRLGYGITGQQDLFGSYADFVYLPVYTENKDGAYYPFGDDYYPTSRPDAYNSKLKWEKTTTYNAGFDLSLLNNKYTVALDYYYRVTDDLLNLTPVPAGTNFKNKVFQNVGSLNNQGIELMLGAKLITKKDLTWDVNYNVTYNRNKITKLTTGSQDGYYVPAGGIFQGSVQAYAVGYPANSFFVYQQVYDNAGKPIEGLYVDRNGDSKINEEDKYFNHKSSPDVTMGLSTKVVYKNFDFGTSIRASIGNYVYNSVAAERLNVGTNGVWSPLGFFENKVMSAFDTNFTGQSGITYLSDYYVQNASFVRIDNITAGYTFGKLFNGVISGGRISATVQNPLVLTGYKGLDPEVFSGIDGSLYPKPIMTVIGLSLNF